MKKFLDSLSGSFRVAVERFAVAIFSLASFAYLGRGFYLLVLGNGGWDLRARWLEQQYIYLGIPPYEAMEGSALVDQTLGAVHSGGYFAWSFFVGTAFIPPGLSLSDARWWFAGLNLIALVGIARFAFLRMEPFGPRRAWLGTLMCLAISSHSTTLSHGQYGILINAFLCLTLILLERKHSATAGICCGIAMVKPSFAGVYLLPLAIWGRIPALASFAVFFALANLVIWIVTGTDPLTINQRVFQWMEFVQEGASGVNLGIWVGLSAGLSVAVVAGIGLLGCGWLAWYLRDAPLLTQFAVAGVIGRLATYHRSYDDVMLLFLLIPLIQLVFGRPMRVVHAAVLLVVGMSLWLPLGGAAPAWVFMLKGAVWLIGLVWLVLHTRPPSRSQPRGGSSVGR